MSITAEDLGTGQFKITNTDVVPTLYEVTTLEQVNENVAQNSSELTRSIQREDDYRAQETAYQGFEDDIGNGSLMPETGSVPQVYLMEYPTNNWYLNTRDQNLQRLNTATANKDYMTNTQIPELQAKETYLSTVLTKIQEL